MDGHGRYDDGNGSFHHRIVKWIAGMTPQRGNGAECERALVEAALEKTVIWPMMEYVRRRQETIAYYLTGGQSTSCIQGKKGYRDPAGS